MFSALRRWSGAVAISPLVCAPEDSREASADAVVLPDETIRSIKADQIELLYAMDRGSGIRPVIAFIITTWIIAGFTSAMPWAALALYCSAWTGYHSLQLTFLKAKGRREHPEYWARQFCLASFCTGLAWGLGSAVWFKNGDPANQAIVVLVIMGVGASSIISRALHRPSTIAFLLPATLPTILSLLLTGTVTGFVLMAFGILFLTGLLQWGKLLNSSQLDSFALRHQNEALIESLSEERRVAERGKEAAEAGNRAKSEFLATMSHEVRTPLNGILGMARILQASDLNEEQKEQLGVIIESGEMLSTVLNDVLDLSKLEAGRLEMEQHPFKLLPAVDGAVRLLAPSARQKGLNVEICTDTAVEAFAKGDVFRVRQVLLNLIGNAIKFTEQGDVTITIASAGTDVLPKSAALSVPEGTIVVAISDTGIGIAPDALPHLFEPFRQEDQSITRKYGGSGLGLAISKRLVCMMGGQIGAVSQPGKGSTFWFILPAASKVETEAMGSSPDHLVVPQPVAPKSILLAEDNDLNAKVAEALLARNGHMITRVRNGREAVNAIRDSMKEGGALPDLILMDIRMPVLSGKEAAGAIRNLKGPGADIPILALTADVSATDFRSDGTAIIPKDYVGLFDGVLTKPITPDQLNAAIADQARPGVRLSHFQSGDPRYDSIHLSDLLSTLGAETFDDVLNTFVDDMEDLSAQLAEAARAADHDAISLHAHDLAGAAANLGFIALAKASRQLKDAAAKRDADGLTQNLADVERAITSVEEILEELKRA